MILGTVCLSVCLSVGLSVSLLMSSVSVSIADAHLFLLLVPVLAKLLALVEFSPKLNEKPTPV